MRREYSDEELKALILNFIMRKGRWGEHYFPIDTMANWLGQVVKNNGKNIKKKVKELANEGYLILHKGNTTASLNPRLKHEIMEYIENNLSDVEQ
ncbi:MAG: hypothetical protein Q8Q69_06005 [Nitrosopumilaceae archaeon]|nr:hypothetical protein [Nitrosopumilaceae archaeon]